ncbi:MAG: hypothetical protein ACLGG9_08465 [Thermoleophilia bacterium]
MLPGGVRSATTTGTLGAPSSGCGAWLDPGRFLGLRMSLDVRAVRSTRATDPRPTDSRWGFQPVELPGRRTRLAVGGTPL